jgi:hypothetical protein
MVGYIFPLGHDDEPKKPLTPEEMLEEWNKEDRFLTTEGFVFFALAIAIVGAFIWALIATS